MNSRNANKKTFVQQKVGKIVRLGNLPHPMDDQVPAVLPDYPEICLMTARAGFDVPIDVAVLGPGDNEELCESAYPPVSAFSDGRGKRIEAACDLLARWLAGEDPPPGTTDYPATRRHTDV